MTQRVVVGSIVLHLLLRLASAFYFVLLSFVEVGVQLLSSLEPSSERADSGLPVWWDNVLASFGFLHRWFRAQAL